LLSAPGRVAHTGKGLTVIGDVEGTISKPTAAIQVAFDTAGFRTKTSLNIRGMLWTKAIVNAAINPLSSLTRLPNGELVKNALIRGVGNRVIEEGISVALAMRVRLTDNPKRLWTRILSATRANKSSMLQDIEKGKRTEIRQLNGAIVRSGKRVRVATPVNDVLMRLVLGLEKSQGL
jgi:2-dehydropantoate 2-reductase